jgi:hypothetical protein
MTEKQMKGMFEDHELCGVYYQPNDARHDCLRKDDDRFHAVPVLPDDAACDCDDCDGGGGVFFNEESPDGWMLPATRTEHAGQPITLYLLANSIQVVEYTRTCSNSICTRLYKGSQHAIHLSSGQ